MAIFIAKGHRIYTWQFGSLTMGAGTRAMQLVCSPIAPYCCSMQYAQAKVHSILGVLVSPHQCTLYSNPTATQLVLQQQYPVCSMIMSRVSKEEDLLNLEQRHAHLKDNLDTHAQAAHACKGKYVKM